MDDNVSGPSKVSVRGPDAGAVDAFVYLRSRNIAAAGSDAAGSK